MLDIKLILKTKISKKEQELKSVKNKKVKVQNINNVEIKPAVFSNTKIVVDKSNFEDIKTLALKQVVSSNNEHQLIAQNKTLLETNKKLNDKLYQYKSVKNKLTSGKVEVKLSNVTNLLNKVLDFINSIGLRSQLESFLNTTTNKIR